MVRLKTKIVRKYTTNLWIGLSTKGWWKFNVSPKLLANVISALVNFSSKIKDIHFTIVYHCITAKQTHFATMVTEIQPAITLILGQPQINMF